ncbi:MAG: hypothetical protein JF588_06600 [Caulobacterales bacterium]|nr:hypothetical protein [Caulobacterales bacterium]
MSQFPVAKRNRTIALQVGPELVVQDRSGQELARLDALDAFLWESADGTIGVPDLARRASESLGAAVDRETVWSALDRLADAGLLEQRATPPGSLPDVSRRAMLTRAGLGLAGLTGAAVVAQPAFAAVASEALGKHDAAAKQSAASAAPREQAKKQAVASQPTREQHTKAMAAQPTREQHTKAVAAQPTREQHTKALAARPTREQAKKQGLASAAPREQAKKQGLASAPTREQHRKALASAPAREQARKQGLA